MPMSQYALNSSFPFELSWPNRRFNTRVVSIEWWRSSKHWFTLVIFCSTSSIRKVVFIVSCSVQNCRIEPKSSSFKSSMMCQNIQHTNTSGDIEIHTRECVIKWSHVKFLLRTWVRGLTGHFKVFSLLKGLSVSAVFVNTQKLRRAWNRKNFDKHLTLVGDSHQKL